MKKTIALLYLWLSKNSKIIVIWLILLATSILFIDVLSDYLVKYLSITDDSFKTIKTFFNWVFTLLVLVIFFRFVWLFIINYSFSKHWGFWIFYFSTLYFLLRRINTDNLEFFFFYRGIYYSDLILFLGILSIVLVFRNFFKNWKIYQISPLLNNWLNPNNKFKESIYKEDIPLIGNVAINNESVVDVIINNIKHLHPNKAFIIAINSEWGQGKTTFLNRVNFKLNTLKKRPITFWFNAWQHQKEESIIQNFLSLLKRELSKYDGNANSYVNEYLNKLLSIEDNIITKGIKFFSQNLLSSNSSIHNSYNDLNNVISKINRQIVVFVDDLDRLNTSEISESLRVLRNVANFKNIIFICGVDMEYLKAEGKLKSDYLDKIFNLEINLPKSNNKYYLEELFKLINNTNDFILSSFEKKEIIRTMYSKENRSFKDRFNNPISSIFISELEFINIPNAPNQAKGKQINSGYLKPSYFFNSFRDVKRFYNQLITNKQLLKTFDNVHTYDYLLFQLLIFKNSWILSSFSDKYINLCFLGVEIMNLHSTTFESLINKPNLDEINNRVVNSILGKLFPNKPSMKERGINQRRYLQFYIKNDVFNENISRSELLKSFDKKSIKELVNAKIIGKEHSNEYLNDIKRYLLRKENLLNIEDFNQILSLIKDKTFNNFDYQEIIYIIYNLEQNLPKGEVLDIFDNQLFTEVDNLFGEFILRLNLHYTNYSGNNEPVFKKSISLNGLEHLNKNYVKDKVISLFNSYLLKENNYPEVSNKLIFCTKEYFNTPNFSIYYDEIKESFKKYFSKSIFQILNDVPPHNYGRWINENYSLLASIFNDDDKKIIEKAKEWSKKTGHIKLDKREFTEIGLENLIKFIENFNNDLPKEVLIRINRMIKEIEKFIVINNGF